MKWVNPLVFFSFQRWTEPSRTLWSTRFGSNRLPLMVQWGLPPLSSSPNLQVLATFVGTW